MICFDTAWVRGQLIPMEESGPAPVEARKQGGGIIPGSGGQRAYTLVARDTSPVPVLLAVPHAGRSYPRELLDRMRHPETACVRLEDRFADLVAEAVARETGAALLVAHAPRAMIDLNRDPHDVDWDMVAEAAAPPGTRHAAGRRARSGLGLVPRRLPGLGELWKKRLSGAELATRLDQVHAPYHAALGSALEEMRDRWGAALLIDLHSMPPLGPKRGADPAPDFVIGDRFGAASDSALSQAALDHLLRSGRTAAHNRPYAGGYVLDRHSAPARGLHGLQIEMCRSIYLDARLREPGPGLAAVVRVLSGLVRRMADELAAARSFRQAAE